MERLGPLSVQWWDVIQYCADEVGRQGDTPSHVYHMLRAWAYAVGMAAQRRWPDYDDVLQVGWRVTPVNSPARPRQINVTVGDSNPPSYQFVPRLLREWCEAIAEGRLNADEAYKAFQEIHPLRDGNGRTGKILYNWILGTLDAPIMPPNFWGSSNP